VTTCTTAFEPPQPEASIAAAQARRINAHTQTVPGVPARLDPHGLWRDPDVVGTYVLSIGAGAAWQTGTDSGTLHATWSTKIRVGR